MARRDKTLPQNISDLYSGDKRRANKLDKKRIHYGLKQAYFDLDGATRRAAKVDIIKEMLGDLIDLIGRDV